MVLTKEKILEQQYYFLEKQKLENESLKLEKKNYLESEIEFLEKNIVFLKEQKKAFDDKIIFFSKKSITITHQMQSLEKDIIDLGKQKIAKSWRTTLLNIITFGIFKYHKHKKINNQISKIQTNLEQLSKPKAIFKENINDYEELLNNNQKEIIKVETKVQQIYQERNNFLAHLGSKLSSDSNPSTLMSSDSSGYNSDDDSRLMNSEDSDFGDHAIKKEDKNNNTRLIPEPDDDGIEVIPEPDDDGIEVIPEPDDDGIEVIPEPDNTVAEGRRRYVESLSASYAHQFLSNSEKPDVKKEEKNNNQDVKKSDNKQLSSCSWQLFSKQNTTFFQNKLSSISEEINDDNEKNFQLKQDQNNLLRCNSEDSGFGDELSYSSVQKSISNSI